MARGVAYLMLRFMHRLHHACHCMQERVRRGILGRNTKDLATAGKRDLEDNRGRMKIRLVDVEYDLP